MLRDGRLTIQVVNGKVSLIFGSYAPPISLVAYMVNRDFFFITYLPGPLGAGRDPGASTAGATSPSLSTTPIRPPSANPSTEYQMDFRNGPAVVSDR